MNNTKEFLISELHRFVKENGKNPIAIDMVANTGYPAKNTIINYFGSWNNALIEAGLKINKRQEYLSGEEICYTCGNYSKYWNTDDFGFRMCRKCYGKSHSDYMNKNLDINSTIGAGFISQRIVAKTLDLKLKDDCNCSIGFDSPYDLYDKNNYGKIDVKGSILKNIYNWWGFHLRNKEIPDTYIMLGFSKDKSNIEHVWITDAVDNLTFNKTAISIKNSEIGLNRARPWEVDAKLYNDAYHNMSLENCSVLRKD